MSSTNNTCLGEDEVSTCFKPSHVWHQWWWRKVQATFITYTYHLKNHRYGWMCPWQRKTHPLWFYDSGFVQDIPSGKLTVCTWKWSFIVDVAIKNGDFSTAILNYQRASFWFLGCIPLLPPLYPPNGASIVHNHPSFFRIPTMVGWTTRNHGFSRIKCQRYSHYLKSIPVGNVW